MICDVELKLSGWVSTRAHARGQVEVALQTSRAGWAGLGGYWPLCTPYLRARAASLNDISGNHFGEES